MLLETMDAVFLTYRTRQEYAFLVLLLFAAVEVLVCAIR